MTLLVVGSGAPEYRIDLLRAIADLDVHLVLDAEPTWELDHVVRAKRVPRLAAARVGRTSPAVVQSIVAAAASAGASGIVTFDEHLVEAVAAATSALGLPGLSPAAAATCRDKAATRRALRARGLDQPGVFRARDALAAPDKLAYPVVVKPTALAGSVGVRLVQHPEALEEAIAEARDSAGAAASAAAFDVIVEDYVVGPEISVDAVVERGRISVAQIARKHVTDDGRFVETGHVVDPNDPLWLDAALLRTVEQALEAVGFGHGVTHTELRLASGGPVVIEINARAPGDLLPLVAERSGGRHLARVAALVALGRDPELRRPTGAVAVRFAMHDAGDRSEREVPPSVPILAGERAEAFALPRHPAGLGRTAYAIASASDGDRAFELAGLALDGLPPTRPARAGLALDKEAS